MLAMLVVALMVAEKSIGQASTEKFGQSQIQYQSFKWKYYDSTHFRVFFYRPGEKLAEHILLESERELSVIVQKMGVNLPRKLNIVLYNSYSDYVQSNIGVNHTSDLNDADGGRLRVSGNNLPVYFTGNHAALSKQVKQGVTNVIKDNMLFGQNIKEIVKNAITMNLPEWYTAGYVEYISNDWTPVLQTEVQNIITLADSNSKFRNIAQKNPKLIGQSFWHFVEDYYGPNTVSNLLYLSRYAKNVESAIAQAMHQEAEAVYKSWRMYYAIPNELLNDSNTFGRKLITKFKPKFEGQYSQFALSPNGRQLAYVQKKDGEWKIILQETDFGDTKVLIQGGFKNLDEVNDPDYPLIAWSPSGNYLATVTTLKDKTLLRLYNAVTQRKSNKVITPRKIERITGLCFTNDDQTLIFTGIKKGKSDLFTYNFRRNLVTNLTNDYYDDHSPSYVSGSGKTGILFLSNRPDTVLNGAELKARKYFDPTFNIYYFNQKNRALLKKVTATNNPISEPIQYGLDKFTYIEKIDGELVRKVIDVTTSQTGGVSFKSGPTNSLPLNILKHQYIPKQESLVEVIKRNGRYQIYNTKVQDLEKYDLENPKQVKETDIKKNKVYQLSQPSSAPYVTSFSVSDSSELLNEIFTDQTVENKKAAGSKLVDVPKKRKQYPYKTTFNPKSLTTSLDNTLLFTRYQNVSQNPSGYNFPDLNGFISFELLDILEDQKLTGGIRVPASLNGTSYFLQYANYQKRLDWKVTYFHQQNKQLFDTADAPGNLTAPFQFLGKVATEYLEGNFSYPFNRANSIRLSVGFRYDHVRYLAQNSFTIEFPNDNEYWSFMRFEYVFDNSLNPMLNIRKGTRAKVFAEYQYRLNKSATGFYQLGLDARNYLPIYKNTILASRVATGLSDGSAKLLYYMGGVDNPIELNSNRGLPPNNLSEYAFQTTATNLRGYPLQAFNGSSYAMINEEIRLPIYNTFFKRPLKSAFLRNLQLIGFIDIGAAWRGLLPLDEVINPVYQTASSNVLANFENKQDVMGIGYGTGIRTKILGYFMRLDVAWNIEKDDRKPMLHLSMATDF